MLGHLVELAAIVALPSIGRRARSIASRCVSAAAVPMVTAE